MTALLLAPLDRGEQAIAQRQQHRDEAVVVPHQVEQVATSSTARTSGELLLKATMPPGRSSRSAAAR